MVSTFNSCSEVGHADVFWWTVLEWVSHTLCDDFLDIVPILTIFPYLCNVLDVPKFGSRSDNREWLVGYGFGIVVVVAF